MRKIRGIRYRVKRHIPAALLIYGGTVIAKSVVHVVKATCDGAEVSSLALTTASAGLALMAIGCVLDKIRSGMKKGGE